MTLVIPTTAQLTPYTFHANYRRWPPHNSVLTGCVACLRLHDARRRI